MIVLVVHVKKFGFFKLIPYSAKAGERSSSVRVYLRSCAHKKSSECRARISCRGVGGSGDIIH